MSITPFQMSLRTRMQSVASCKASTFEELEDDTRIELTREEMSQLPVMIANSDELGSPCTDLPNPAPDIIFVLVRDGKRYLVNTEGFDYARYIVRIHTITSVSSI
jgi:hypothetical protein